MKTIYVVDNVNRAGLDILEKNGFRVYEKNPSLSFSESRQETNLEDVFAIIIRANRLTKSDLKLFPNLKLIVRHGVGVDNLPLQALKAAGIGLTYTPGINSSSVAELTLGFMLLLSRHLQLLGTPKIEEDGTLIKQKTVGLIGYGEIARRVAALLQPFQVKLLVYNHRPKKLLYGELVSLDTLLKKSDIISLHIPATAETKNIIDDKAIRKMKKNAYLINTARGSLVNTTALYNALASKQIAGAAVDTLDDSDSFTVEKLTKLTNFVATPHIGANTSENLISSSKRCAEEILRFKNGQEPICSYF
ncbi:NAD(P)-dependent oxidoreductase [Liquorilactobacillus oeni]|uniref:Lactate dehydrogenase related dehydrogenase n=1 Tax=Liquorilactobacillus oeni DSM 19972 TaxID=1423777 RepID=A0A0R1M9D4_9LACO|nr:NAD(P)-dependent oxidoreductase [Liquorilactobacillus oeni]KRL04545.1 lactate dehydrogenase related dehydrogenase [Liquorilactobacillus oeni DSM 19972]